MGYTHSWRRARELDAKAFAAAMADCLKVVDAAQARGIVLEDLEVEPDAIFFNGSCETFVVERVSSRRDHLGMEPAGFVFEFCKTAYGPYDVAVTACLVVLKSHLGDAILVTSNGGIHDWQDGIDLAAEIGVACAWDFLPSGSDWGETLEPLERAVRS